MHTLQSILLQNYPGVTHAFTTRREGVSKQPYNSNNLAFHVGDKEKDVLLNHAALAKALGYDLDALIHMRQIHSDRVVIVDETFTFDDPPECDALIAGIVNKPLMVMTADCTPLLLYDPHQHVIAAIHAGRAGAFKNIVAKSISKMREHFHSRPSDILAILGPSIGVCCYEVNETINDEAHALGLGYAMQKRQNKFYLDVNRILKAQLNASGVSYEHTEDLNRCTSCENNTFFSYRADGQQTGRMAGIIFMR
jgi:YfiH family protein